MTIGTLMVGIDATAVDAKQAIKDLADDAKEKAASIGNIEIAPGSIFSQEYVGQAIQFAHEHFMTMIDDIRTFNELAVEAGQSIEEFTKGAFTQEDVDRMTAFEQALSDLTTTLQGGRKELLIDISPLAVEAIKDLNYLADQIIGQVVRVQNFARDAGEFAGNVLTPRRTGAINPQTENRRRFSEVAGDAVGDAINNDFDFA